MKPLHILPFEDVIEHETDESDCICGPHVDLVYRQDGTIREILRHHRLEAS